MKKYLLIFILLISINVRAQLTNGSVAPDFTLTDYYGNTHNLYSYLNNGKTVFLEIFAAHCPVCWGYHQTHTMKNIYNSYGPNGTNEIMVLALEHDQWNDSNAFIGNGPAWVTQGNWLNETPFPIFNVEDPYRAVFVDYNVNSYPVVYKICPDKIVERVFTSETEIQLYQKVQDCQSAMSLLETKNNDILYFDPLSKMLYIDQFQKLQALEIINLQGQLIKSLGGNINSTIFIAEIKVGVYIISMHYKDKIVYKKLHLN